MLKIDWFEIDEFDFVILTFLDENEKMVLLFDNMYFIENNCWIFWWKYLIWFEKEINC